MAGTVPKLLRKEMWDSIIGSDDVKLVAMSDAYVFDDAHEFLDDVSGDALGTEATLTGVTTTDGILDADQPAVIADVDAPDVVAGFWVYVDTGSPATSRLLAFQDTRADSSPISIEGDGTDLNVSWPAGFIATI